MKGIIFDFNGTMFQDSHLHEAAWVHMVKKYSKGELTEHDISVNLHGRTNKEILNALKRCFKLIDAYNYSDELDPPLSTRQAFCAKQTLLNIINHNYNAALRYLELCIDNDRHGFDLIISMNEYVLYNCLITGFIEALEHEEINNKDKEQDT